jgi:hypothetical protein
VACDGTALGRTAPSWPADGLDDDLLLAVQAREELAGVVTMNEKHFAGLVDVWSWTAVPMSTPA